MSDMTKAMDPGGLEDLYAEIERLRADLATHVAATEETENRIIDAEFEATRLRALNAELRAALHEISQMTGYRTYSHDPAMVARAAIAKAGGKE